LTDERETGSPSSVSTAEMDFDHPEFATGFLKNREHGIGNGSEPATFRMRCCGTRSLCHRRLRFLCHETVEQICHELV
jgi:hypothetical protein